jgi:hypothetical protein
MVRQTLFPVMSGPLAHTVRTICPELGVRAIRQRRLSGTDLGESRGCRASRANRSIGPIAAAGWTRRRAGAVRY